MTGPELWKGALELFSALGTVGAAWVGWRLYQLQKSLEDAKKPKVTVWFNPTANGLGLFSFVNLGQASLLVHKLDVIAGANIHAIEVVDMQSGVPVSHNSESPFVRDIVFLPNQPFILMAYSGPNKPSQFQVRLMYYDNRFEFLDIDTGKYGPYLLKGY